MLTARTTAPQAAHLGQILAVQMTQIAEAAVTPTVTVEAAAVPNLVQIVRDSWCALVNYDWYLLCNLAHFIFIFTLKNNICAAYSQISVSNMYSSSDH